MPCLRTGVNSCHRASALGIGLGVRAPALTAAQRAADAPAACLGLHETVRLEEYPIRMREWAAPRSRR